MITEKRCPKCKQTLQANRFYIDRHNGRLQSYCRDCKNANMRVVRAQDKLFGLPARNNSARPLGELNPSAKITAHDVGLIRELRERHNLSYRVIAEKFDISIVTVGQICRRERWSHVA